MKIPVLGGIRRSMKIYNWIENGFRLPLSGSGIKPQDAIKHCLLN
jgi:hypothetical protein